MSARDRTVIGVIVAVVALAGVWFVGLAPKRKAIAAADTKIAAQQQRLQQAQAVVAAGEGAKRDYAANATTVARIGKAIPADDDMASLVYQLQAVAQGAKVQFKSIKLAGSSAGAATAGAATAPATGATGATATATQAAATTLPPGAVVGTAGLPTLPFTFIFQGSFLDMQRFVARVDSFVKAQGKGVLVSGRLLTIDGIALGNVENDTSSTVKATITATAYLSPDSATSAGSTAAGSTATGPTAGATATGPTATGTPSGAAGATNSTSAVTAAPSS
jgi:Tfp pilus assembly protein PilO